MTGAPLKTETVIRGLDDSDTYRVQVRARNAADCAEWPLNRESATGYTALAAPTDLAITPMALRKAELTWSFVSSAGRYIIEVRPEGGMWNPPVIGESDSGDVVLGADYEIELDKVTGRKHEIDIDNDGTPEILYSYKGLQDNDAYEFRVKAARGGNYPDSAPSAPIKIIDNTILTEGRATGSVANGIGQARLEWDSIAGAQTHKVQYRKLREGRSDEDWHESRAGPYGLTSTSEQKTVPRSSSSTASTRIGGLSEGEIYAFQLNYVTNGGQKVFSARDAYAWMSSEPPQHDHRARAGTYPFFGYWERGRYEYTVCADTFKPSREQEKWLNLINHAFKQWERAAPDAVTVNPVVGDCRIDSAIRCPLSARCIMKATKFT